LEAIASNPKLLAIVLQCNKMGRIAVPRFPHGDHNGVSRKALAGSFSLGSDRLLIADQAASGAPRAKYSGLDEMLANGGTDASPWDEWPIAGPANWSSIVVRAGRRLQTNMVCAVDA